MNNEIRCARFAGEHHLIVSDNNTASIHVVVCRDTNDSSDNVNHVSNIHVLASRGSIRHCGGGPSRGAADGVEFCGDVERGSAIEWRRCGCWRSWSCEVYGLGISEITYNKQET